MIQQQRYLLRMKSRVLGTDHLLAKEHLKPHNRTQNPQRRHSASESSPPRVRFRVTIAQQGQTRLFGSD